MNSRTTFLKYVIPSIIAFALSGVYSIVDGYFVGNTIGDAGLSAINIAYPIVALLQSIGTGIGMGGAVHYSISTAEGKHQRAKQFIAVSWWLLVLSGIIFTILTFITARPALVLLGAEGVILTYATDYIRIMALGASMQIIGVGLIPFIRNFGSSSFAMHTMLGGFFTNIVLDYLFIWVLGQGMAGAALATVIGQCVTFFMALIYTVYKKKLFVRINVGELVSVCKSIFMVGLAPFGLELTPNVSLVLINRFSASYGGERAIATYACIAYIICIIYLLLQGVGDGCQPLMSKYYGERKEKDLSEVTRMAYTFAVILAFIGCIIMYLGRWHIGVLFGSSAEVNAEIAKIIPIFLISVPFVAITRISTAGFYATEKAVLSYILTFIEPILMLVLMLILPPLFGGQIMIWWSTVFARIISAVLALIMTKAIARKNIKKQQQK